MNIKNNIDVYKYLTLRTHLIARYFVEVKNPGELREAVKYAKDRRLPFCLLGGGSNLIFRNGCYLGLIIKNSYREIETLEKTPKTVTVRVSSGYPVSLLVAKAIKNGWAGFECYQGLPGTVGGAVYMNSKWNRPLCYFGDNLTKGTILTTGGMVRSVKHAYFKFGYDFSCLQRTKQILLDATFKLKKAMPEDLESKARRVLAYRKKTQPIGVATCGCFFQNIRKTQQRRLHLKTNSAGFLIDQCGLKNYRVGDFAISDKHANFIINTNSRGEEYSDLFKLIDAVKEAVRQRYKIELKEEVVII